ncbi:Glycosyltransferase involved in cell wall bisynthesis [Pseudomonas sp. URIL14HWK12:I9]|nr:glycosyltransferase involved in cell wall biosynthesis [Pseudomonas sp. URIL14HWK12:I12]PVZ25685.1 glycosyltransferase involved in cell wall biosynthesis [Pseudomonas sp. URIL14HWK12:I10]PVZ36791.1 glycosyltransferase involved in cell wall biosynthesis [Pseudomonas sp. URIL14HWK12:I11]SNZ12606.1 Glycosyltransferase involved in cell wall bisynthesis [Pseudomonas sp. URIL14HWK12:I9]
MKKLLFIVNVDWFFISHRLPLALAAQQAGFEVHLACAVTDRLNELERHGIVVHPLALDRRSASPLQAFKSCWAMFRLMRMLKPTAVHLVTIKPVLLGGLAARLAGIERVIAAISGLGFVFMATGPKAAVRRCLVALLYRLALRRGNVKVIFQNEDDQTLLEQHAGIHPSQAVRIRGSGVDLAAWLPSPLPEGPALVVMAARMLKDKGVLEYVEAARALQGYRGARFVLVGGVDEGNPTSLTSDQLQKWSEAGVIDWWGARSDMAEVFSQAHIVVLPSYREGLPKCLIEAAACGRAVVTTDVPGCRDAIEPGQSGLLVEVRNAGALAQGIRKLLDDPVTVVHMGAAGRALAEQAFDVREVARMHMALYEGR